MTVTAEKCLEIEFLTRGQAEVPLWYSVRAKCITGSKCGKILCQHTRTDALLKSVLYPTTLLNKPPPIQWGIHNEKLARNLYVQHMRKQANFSTANLGSRGTDKSDTGSLSGSTHTSPPFQTAPNT